jgi:Fic family protein
MNIQEKLLKIMKFGGFTQNSLSRELGVSFPTVNSWIHNKSTPRSEVTEKINNLLAKLEAKNIVDKQALTLKIDNVLNKAKKSNNIFNSELFTRKDLYEDLLVKLTYHSDGIEGSTLTLRETASIILENLNIKEKTLIEQIEAKNHKSALVYVFTHIQQGGDIDETLLKRLHEILMNGILDTAGSYRYHPVRIVGSQTITANYLKIPELISNLFAEIKNTDLDAITQASVFHAKFEIIHPFPDGNGRVGRLILNAMLLKKNIIPVIIDKRKKSVYYNCLDKAFADGDFDYLINFIAESIEDTYTEFEM